MDDDLKFSWTAMFLVSGISSFLFSFIIKFLEGTHSQILLNIGVIALVFGVISWAGKNIVQNIARNKKKKRLTP